MAGFIRRVVTGHDRNGKTIVLSDEVVDRVYSNPVRPGHKSTDLWKTTAMPAPVTFEEPDPCADVMDFVPPMGVKIRISELEPEAESIRGLSKDVAASWYKDSGHTPASTFGKGGRHPLLHRTETIDYAVVLEGEMTLVMDDQDIVLKQGDVVVQRGTNHAWSNRSGKKVRMLYIIIDGRFDPELKALFDRHDGH